MRQDTHQDGLRPGCTRQCGMEPEAGMCANCPFLQELEGRAPAQASDDVWKRDEPESPCIKVCVIHPETRLCTGCFRSIDEITAWSKMSNEDRRAVMAELPGREPQLTKRRGGRLARLKRKL